MACLRLKAVSCDECHLVAEPIAQREFYFESCLGAVVAHAAPLDSICICLRYGLHVITGHLHNYAQNLPLLWHHLLINGKPLHWLSFFQAEEAVV